ncbi:MAG: heme-binding domain-containing protein [Bryobacteraceae bacterium]
MVKKIVLVLVILLVAVQFVPQSVFPRTNLPVDETKTRAVRARALTPQVGGILLHSCNNCHSSQTIWPWYSKVAPVSWLLSDDVVSGRRELSFSDWASYNSQRAAQKLQTICEEVRGGDMPPWYYTPLHSGSKLSDSQRQAVCGWTTAERAALGAPASPAAAPRP